jgi:membrane-bound inhibitor of C-type lysozyme
MKLIIAGSRNFTDYQKLKTECDQLLQKHKNVEIVSGGHYKGADKLGIQYAHEKGFNLMKFPAEWNKFGKAAGPKRNKEMARYADALIVFWDGNSKGTKSMINLAKNEGLKIRIIFYVNQS